MRKHFCFWAIALLAAGVVVGAGQLFSQEGDTPSFANLTDKEMEEFLLHAEVIDRRGIPVGITRPERFTLSDGKLTRSRSTGRNSRQRLAGRSTSATVTSSTSRLTG
jgi:hypothetical protein